MKLFELYTSKMYTKEMVKIQLNPLNLIYAPFIHSYLYFIKTEFTSYKKLQSVEIKRLFTETNVKFVLKSFLLAWTI